ncbi:SAM-dependent methyltransferase [Streptococcus pneumoniae]|nr:SAM-dependent methyltransferase [Streptococcus pneumoniae]
MIMATYETFAAVYDAVMDDSLYDKWTNFSLRHLPKTKERKKLLELACGQEFNQCASLRLVLM